MSDELDSPKVNPRTWATFGLLAFSWLLVGWCDSVWLLATRSLVQVIEGGICWSGGHWLLAAAAWRLRKERSEFPVIFFYVAALYVLVAALATSIPLYGFGPMSVATVATGFRVFAIAVGLAAFTSTWIRTQPGDIPEDPEERWRTPADGPPAVDDP